MPTELLILLLRISGVIPSVVLIVAIGVALSRDLRDLAPDVAKFLLIPEPIGEVIARSENETFVRAAHRSFEEGGESLPATFEEYLLDQNSELGDALEALSQAGASVAVVSAPGGYGKSGLLDHALAQKLPGRPVTQVDLRKLGDASGIDAVDLVLVEKEVNRLPLLSEAQLDALNETLTRTSNANSVILLDSLDELSNEASRKVLRRLSALIESRSLGERDVVVFSRPEVIGTLNGQDQRDSLFHEFRTVTIIPQRVSKGALRLRVKNYLDYAAEPGRKIGDSVKTVRGVNDNDSVERVTSKLVALITREPWLIEMLRLAFLSKLLIDHVRDTEMSLGNTPADMRSNVLKRVIERGVGSHKRPSKQNTRYYNALMAIALCNLELDPDGYFKPPLTCEATDPDDVTKRFAFAPADVLQRSGLVSVMPSLGGALMRYEPVWLRSELARESRATVLKLSWIRLLFGIGAALALAYVAFHLVRKLRAAVANS